MNKISYKITTPIVLIVLLSLSAIVFIVGKTALENRKELIDKHIKAQLYSWDYNMKRIEKKALSIASYCSVGETTRQAYKIYEKTHNIDEASTLLETEFRNTSKFVKENTGDDVRIHFHTADLKSLIRVWTNKRGDDLSGFRETIKKVIKTNKAVSGIEIGRAGTVIRGVVPVRNSEGELIGSVESFFPIQYLFKKLKTEDKSEFAFFLLKDYTNISDKDYTTDKSISVAKKYNLVATRNNTFYEDELNVKEIEKLAYDKEQIYKGDYLYAGKIVKDFSGKKIGVIIYRYDTHTFEELINSMRNQVLTVMFLVLLFFIGLIYYLLKKIILNPISKGVKFANEIAQGNYNTKIDVYTKDEIGLLANSLRGMLQSLKKGVNLAEKIASGDLTTKVESNNLNPLELALIKMQNKLYEIITNVSLSIENMTLSSEMLSQSMDQIASGANEQAASSEEIAAALEEMSAIISESTDNANNANSFATKSAKTITIGQKTFDETMLVLKNISKKIIVINKLAEKTDILAINAAIEAARAGENGKGFGVVAQEIRQLAENSKNAAIQIGKAVKESKKRGSRASELLLKVVPEIERTAILIHEISTSSEEQKSGINQINTSVAGFTEITQENTQASEEISLSSKELAQQAIILKNIISYFKTDINKSEQQNKKTKEIKNSKLEADNSKKTNIDLDLEKGGFDNDDFEAF